VFKTAVLLRYRPSELRTRLGEPTTVSTGKVIYFEKVDCARICCVARKQNRNRRNFFITGKIKCTKHEDLVLLKPARGPINGIVKGWCYHLFQA